MRRSERACQIWSVLAWAARNRQTISYGDLGQLIGVPTAGLGKLLGPIQFHCEIKGLPPLTALVVQRDTGLPGSGFTGASASELGRAQAEVFAKDWLKEGNPQADQLELATRKFAARQGGTSDAKG